MISGIYLLTFPNGSQYVGKSIDIGSRWKQHYDKLMNGKAADRLQRAFDDFGNPQGTILAECHHDHIDVLETYYINLLRPDLNSAKSAPVDPYDLEIIGKNMEWLKLSTAGHIDLLEKSEKEGDEYEERICELKRGIEDLSIQRTEEEIRTDIGQAYVKLEEEYDLMYERYATVKQYCTLPWWKRLFTKPPMV
jgi:group I intron endonuclease